MGLILPVAVEEVEKRRERMNEMALIIFGNEFNVIDPNCHALRCNT